jgi:hypothetical protein
MINFLNVKKKKIMGGLPKNKHKRKKKPKLRTINKKLVKKWPGSLYLGKIKKRAAQCGF